MLFIYKRCLKLIVVYSLLCLFLWSFAANVKALVSQQKLEAIKQEFGIEAQQRVLAWQQLIRNNQNKPVLEKLVIVNRFFNQLTYNHVAPLTGQDARWLTPIEFLAIGEGDCNDYAMGKYFTLRKLGIPDKKLRLIYVKAVELNRAHKVLAYYEDPAADPLILDNLIDAIKPASQRTDLVPVYSFNAEGLWLTRQKQRDERVGNSERILPWQRIQKRMQEQIK